ncbi:TIR domain-containing protein [Myxococcus landrumensis]|uniref:TIR domain-containing protein n=1 Tax=Myxococcus landrumensis TaxID=2813577 RepID=A0ABX7NGF5_9BACT|nr:TIR domain-containing protein [Myxococcus landrumus]QSQ17921.1 TIR domain-containing protein [Myxococcus landrumus]
MADSTGRFVFFSFHFQRDIMRVQQIKNHYVTKFGYQAAGYFDGSLSELAKTEGKLAVKRAINKGLPGSSVTCVLIGAETYARHWVHYEIFRSIELGKGVVGIRIHQLKDPKNGPDNAGPNPFDYLGYGGSDTKKTMTPFVNGDNGWTPYEDADPISPYVAPFLAPGTRPVLSSLFEVYDWVSDDGYNNFPNWIARAARQAGR